MLHIGQYLLVCRYFTIQLLQTVRGETQLLRLFGTSIHRTDSTETGRQLGKARAGSGTLTGVETLCDGGGIHEVARAETANDVFIQVFDLHPNLLLRTHPPSLFTGLTNLLHLILCTSQLQSTLLLDSAVSPRQGGGGGVSFPAQQRAPRTAGALFSRTRPTLLSLDRLDAVGDTTRRRPGPAFGNPARIARAYRAPRCCAGALRAGPATARPLARLGSHS